MGDCCCLLTECIGTSVCNAILHVCMHLPQQGHTIHCAAVALQMMLQTTLALSLQTPLSVYDSSLTALRAVLLSASFVWTPWAMMMPSGIAHGAASVCCTCFARKPGAGSRLQRMRTRPHKTMGTWASKHCLCTLLMLHVMQLAP